jgi:hypothetical protein
LTRNRAKNVAVETESSPSQVPTEDFTYEQLEEPYNKQGKIRLLKILELEPADGPLEPIQLRLDDFGGTNDPKPYYMALSYMWGGPDDMREILADGGRFRVQANL